MSWFDDNGLTGAPSIHFDPSQASPSSPAAGAGTMGSSASGIMYSGNPTGGNGQLPGDPNLPGYGDWNTSNPWRDSLSYEQIRDFGRGQQGGTNPLLPSGSTAPTAGGGPVTMADFDAAWQASPYPGTVDGLKQFFAAHPEYAAAGITLGGSKGDKVFGPGGSYWGDAVISAGLGGQGKSHLSGADAGGGTNANGQSLGYMTAPFTGQYNLPTLSELEGMPGYQAGLHAYTQGVEHSAAARGTLLTGGTVQRLGQAASDYASQQYGNLAGLQGGAFNTNYNIFRNNQTDPFNKYLSLAQLGRPT